ncbi:hypothetical protein FSARC_7990 [Fusarium sarcochroum]|uniref:Thioesterase n=1 Tax=Fusarium sarcochroum TaxID=1208366 RepID=A0A8H4TTU7_9HYPO|nr:hypothetical protein FSARC_7990 [Fusarium sarcochroum]
MSFVPRLRPSRVFRPLATVSKVQLRCYTCTNPRQSQASSTVPQDTTPLSSRWFSDLQARIQELKSSKYPSECVSQAEKLHQHTSTAWIELLAGREGYLTDKSWRGLDHYQLLWGDMVSRVRFVRHHAEDAASAEQRSQWYDLPTPRSLGLILKSIKTEFKVPMTFPDHITVLYKLAERPTYKSTSLLMEAWVLSDQHRRLAAKCIDDTAIYDYTTSKKSVLKPFMVEKFQDTFDRQAESQIKCEKDARDVISAVESLERQFQ